MLSFRIMNTVRLTTKKFSVAARLTRYGAERKYT